MPNSGPPPGINIEALAKLAAQTSDQPDLRAFASELMKQFGGGRGLAAAIKDVYEHAQSTVKARMLADVIGVIRACGEGNATAAMTKEAIDAQIRDLLQDAETTGGDTAA